MINLKEGQILVSKYGYDTTNIRFYQVVKEAKENQFVQIKQISGSYCENEKHFKMHYWFAKPNKNHFKTEIVMKKKLTSISGASSDERKAQVKVSKFEKAYLWNGVPVSANGRLA